MEQQIDSKLGKEYVRAVYCPPAYLTYMQSMSCEMLGWMKHEITRRNTTHLRYATDNTLMAESEEELKNLLRRVREESGKADLNQHSKNSDHGIRSHYFMANRWENNGNSERFYFLGFQNHCRW